MKIRKKEFRDLSLFIFLLLLGCSHAAAQGSAFTYQGRLADNGNPANGNYDLQFTLLDATSNSVAGPLTNAAVAVTNGLFTVMLDFGNGVLDGQALWLQIGVRSNGSVAACTILDPTQPLTAAPYAITAGSVPGGATASQLTTAVSSLVSTNDPRPVILSGGLTLTNNSTSPSAPLLQLTALRTNETSTVNYLLSVAPYDSSHSGSFNLSHEGGRYNGIFDDVMTLGWNQSAGGQAQATGVPALWLQWEQYFNQFPSQAQSEFMLNFVDANGNSDRPLFFGLDVTNLFNWQEHHVGTYCDFRYPMQGYSNTWLTLSPGQTIWNFDNTNGVQLTYSSGYVQFSSYHTYFTPAQDNLLMQGWDSIGFGSASMSGGSLALSGTFSVNNSASFGNQATFNNTATFNAVLQSSGSAGQPGDTPLIVFNDNNANGNSRNFGLGVMYYQGEGHGSLTLNVSADKNGSAYNSSAVGLMSWSSNRVVTYGNSIVNGSMFIATNVVCPSPLGTGGWLWNSNNALFWVTTSGTNLLSAP